MIHRSLCFRVLLLASLALLSACGAAESDKPQAAMLKTVEDRFAIRVGDRTVQMQLAVEAGEMQRGLMFRTSMGAEEGMLFVYATPQQMSFWMRNTQIPLDIGFFDASGELKEIYPLYPLDERSVTSRGRTMLYALEMNQGWFKAAGIKPGAKLDLAALREGLKARGVTPRAAEAR